MNEWNEQMTFAAIAGLGILILLLFVWVAVLNRSLGKIKKAHRKLVGDTAAAGVGNIEEVLHAVHERLAAQGVELSRYGEAIGQHERRLAGQKGRIGVHRFNAFEQSGNDMSFSIAFLNDAQDGLVFTGIHGREQMFLYAKPIEQGKSVYALSPEEKQAISQAMQKE